MLGSWFAHVRKTGFHLRDMLEIWLPDVTAALRQELEESRASLGNFVESS
jgi:hypothetical protein